MSGTVTTNYQHCSARAEVEMVEEDYVRYRTVPTNYQHCGVRAGARDG